MITIVALNPRASCKAVTGGSILLLLLHLISLAAPLGKTGREEHDVRITELFCCDRSLCTWVSTVSPAVEYYRRILCLREEHCKGGEFFLGDIDGPGYAAVGEFKPASVVYDDQPRHFGYQPFQFLCIDLFYVAVKIAGSGKEDE